MKQTILDGRMIYLKPYSDPAVFACEKCALHIHPVWKHLKCPWTPKGRLVCSAEHSVFIDPLDVITQRLIG